MCPAGRARDAAGRALQREERHLQLRCGCRQGGVRGEVSLHSVPWALAPPACPAVTGWDEAGRTVVLHLPPLHCRRGPLGDCDWLHPNPGGSCATSGTLRASCTLPAACRGGLAAAAAPAAAHKVAPPRPGPAVAAPAGCPRSVLWRCESSSLIAYRPTRARWACTARRQAGRRGTRSSTGRAASPRPPPPAGALLPALPPLNLRVANRAEAVCCGS